MNGYVYLVGQNGRMNFMQDYEKKTNICNKCNKPISKENRVRYTGARGYRKACRICINKQVLKSSRKRQKALKEWRSYYT